MAGFLVFLIGELPKKSCFLFGVAFAIPCYKCKASKAWYRRKLPTNNAVQTTNHYGETSLVTCNWQSGEITVQRGKLFLRSFSLDKVNACVRSLVVSPFRDNRAKKTQQQRAPKSPAAWKRGPRVMSCRCKRAMFIFIFKETKLFHKCGFQRGP